MGQLGRFRVAERQSSPTQCFIMIETFQKKNCDLRSLTSNFRRSFSACSQAACSTNNEQNWQSLAESRKTFL